MRGVNKAILIGTLGRDPEVRFTPGGDAVANFSIAVNEEWKDKDGQKQEKVEWLNVVAWRKLGEICGEYLRKGSQCYIEGKIQTRSWEDKEGNKRYMTEIIAYQMQMLGGKPKRQEESGGFEDPGGPDVPEDDIPF